MLRRTMFAIVTNIISNANAVLEYASSSSKRANEKYYLKLTEIAS